MIFCERFDTGHVGGKKQPGPGDGWTGRGIWNWGGGGGVADKVVVCLGEPTTIIRGSFTTDLISQTTRVFPCLGLFVNEEHPN